MAAEGSDSFDTLLSILNFLISKSPELKESLSRIIENLIAGKRYLKGEYKANCASATGSEVADHCRFFALSDPKMEEYRHDCDHTHEKRCTDCESLKTALSEALEIVNAAANLNKKEKDNFVYDLNEAIIIINTWKAHILTVIHQETQKTDILENLNSNTAFIIVDFAMKFLSRRYRESMAKWFGKAGHGMHVLHAVYLEDTMVILSKEHIFYS